MSDIKVKEEKIKDKTGVWYLAADLLQKNGIKNTGGNQYTLMCWLKDNHKSVIKNDFIQRRYCQMLWIEVWIGKGLSDFLQHTIFKFHVLGHKVKLFKAFQSSPTFFCLPTEFKSHGFCGLCRSVALC